MSTRLLIVLLDGADGTLLERWSSDGTLPVLTTLRHRGQIRRLTAPVGITDDGLWASFQYGASLGEHGRYFWHKQLSSGAMGMAYLEESQRLSFWNRLSDQGQRVAVFDVPKCGHPRPINGLHLVDWLVHWRYFREPLSHPQSLATAVGSRFGAPPPSPCGEEPTLLSDPDLLSHITHLRQSVAQKSTAAIHYLAGEEWDLFLVGFQEAHCAGHLLWDLADSSHPSHEPGRSDRLGHPVRTLLQALDSAIGSLIAAAGPGAVVAVITPTNMEPNGTLIHLMPTVVERLNLSLGETHLSLLLRRVSSRLRQRPSRPPLSLLPYDENAVALRFSSPQGNAQVSRPDTFQLERTEHLLRGLMDAETGQQVVRVIERPSRDLPGARRAELPDLLVCGWPGQIPRAVLSPELGRISAAQPLLRPGNHASGGLIMLQGADLEGINGFEDMASLAQRIADRMPS